MGRPSRRPAASRATPTRCGAFLLLASLALALPALALGVEEYRVKGAFLYSFAKFVEWPRDSIVGTNDELRVCVLGSGEVTSVLSEVMHGKSAGKRGVTVRRIDDLTEVGWCRIFFLTKSADMEPEVIANSLGAASVLTVGETSGFASRGLMVNFVTESSKVRFEINEKAAERAGLKISSKLLRLASSVVD
jgi:hypothetical protein